jgi:hypothetical protein
LSYSLLKETLPSVHSWTLWLLRLKVRLARRRLHRLAEKEKLLRELELLASPPRRLILPVDPETDQRLAEMLVPSPAPEPMLLTPRPELEPEETPDPLAEIRSELGLSMQPTSSPSWES